MAIHVFSRSTLTGWRPAAWPAAVWINPIPKMVGGPRLQCWPPLVMGSQLLAHCRMPVNPYIILIYRSVYIYIPGMNISELMEFKFFMLKYSMLKYVKIYSNFWPPIHHLTEGQVSARQLASKGLRYLECKISMSNSWTINWDPGPHPVMLDHGLTLSSTRISNIYVGEYPNQSDTSLLIIINPIQSL